MFEITSVKEDEAYCHDTGDEEERKLMFWLHIPEPQGIFNDAAEYAHAEPLEGELERVTQRTDFYIAETIEHIAYRAPAIEWLFENDHPFELDTGYWQSGGLERALIRLLDDQDWRPPTQTAMLFKLTFGGQ